MERSAAVTTYGTAGETVNDARGGHRWTWFVESDRLAAGAALSSMFGYGQDRVGTGQDVLDLLHDQDRPRHLAAMRAHLSAPDAPFECASRLRCADGNYRWVFMAGAGLSGADGRIERVVGVLHPLSALAQSGRADLPASSALAQIWQAGVAALEEREREQARRLAAEAATTSQREFLATVSHEIRNPLSVIFANVALLRAEAERSGKSAVVDRLATLERASGHLRDLVSDVLDLAKVDAGRMDLKPGWFDLEPLLVEIEEMANTLTRERDILFILDPPADPQRLYTDRVKLKQILINLLGNAVKFTERGRITLSVVEEPNGLLFAMEDTGCGIPADKLEMLFKAFSQLQEHPPRIRGTGLGLYISERLARMMGGRMSVVSMLGEGSTFELKIPRVLPTKAERVPSVRTDDRLVIGHTVDLITLDPHYEVRTTALSVALHIFDSLTRRSADGGLAPGLAERWEPLGESGWRFHLRSGVSFHDGSSFEAEDVRATIDRLRRVEREMGPFAGVVKPIVGIEAPQAGIIDLLTAEPAPMLPNDLSHLAIISRQFVHADQADFDTLQATVGTGPFRPVARPDHATLHLRAFNDHWAGPPTWREVEFRLVPESAQASVSALLAGDIDLLDAVGPEQVLELKARDDIRLWSRETNRFWYLYFDQSRDETPYVTDRSGRPIRPNPLKDERVRRAISYAIDRDFICDRLLAGEAIPAGGIARAGMFGADPGLEPHRYDPAAARALLAGAGYADGFNLTIHGSRDRTFIGATTLRAISLMLNGIGIACRAEALPVEAYYARTARHEFAVGLLGWGSITGETSYTLRMLLGSRGSARGFGAVNRGGYSNPRFDAILSEALVTIDDRRRERLLREAAAVALHEVAIAPLCLRRVTWASKRGLVFEPSADSIMLPSAARRP